MAPRLDGWDRELRDKGLRVIEVEYGPSTERTILDAHMRQAGTAYTVLYDDDGHVTERFDVGGFPTAFVIDRGGRVVWHGYPTQKPAAVQAALDRALAK
jgi:YD repeat-containing protein